MAHTPQSLDDQVTAIKPVSNTAISIAASGVTVKAKSLLTEQMNPVYCEMHLV